MGDNISPPYTRWVPMANQRKSITRFRNGSLFLLLLVIMSVIGYRISGMTWLDSLYFVVITLSSVGFGEQSGLDPWVQFMTILLIVFGCFAVFYLTGGLVEMLIEGEVDRVLGARRVSKDVNRMKDHVIICGYGRTGEILADELVRRKTPCLIVDCSPERVAEALEKGFKAVNGDATEEETLTAVGVERARAAVTTLPNDAENVFITLTARNLNRELLIIARAESQSTEKKLLQAGADRVVLPAATGAMRMAIMLTQPSTLELIELATGGTITDVQIDEMRIAEDCPLAGRTLREIDIRAKFGLLVVAIQDENGKMQFNPASDVPFSVGRSVIVMGRADDIQRFAQDIRKDA